ncbi:restriction endonuclease subunit S [Crossiella sp. CA198]|uniref:restriction endonuclease subunit S n=1 Tax=Crossiella sp. CA198 TaxID=3455607 RepID=UPI003F8D649A
MIKPFNIPAHWKWVRFGEIARVASNLVDPKGFPDSPHIAPNHIESKSGRLLPYSTIRIDGVSSTKNKFRSGQILYSKIRPNLAKVTLVDFDGLCSADMYPIDTSLHSGYLHHWMLTPEFTSLASKQQGRILLPKINAKELSALPVPVPDNGEQQRIARALHQVDVLRAKRREAIALLDNLARSIFLDMFGDPRTNPMDWPITPLGQVVAEFRYGTSEKSSEIGHPTLRIPNILGGTLDMSIIKNVPVSESEFHRLRLVDGDLLFVRTNGNPDYVGRCAVFSESTVLGAGFPSNGFIYASYLIRARLHRDVIDSVYVREYLLGTSGRAALKSKSKTSAGQFNINIHGLSDIRLPLPPIELQEKFAQRIKKLEEAKQTHSSHLLELDALFASVQYRAFRGELWPDTVPAA